MVLGNRASSSIGSLRKSHKKPPQIRTSHIVLGLLGCALVIFVVLFGSSLHFLLSSSSGTDTAESVNGRDKAASSSQSSTSRSNLRPPAANNKISLQVAQEALHTVKNEFYERYGGQSAAEKMLEKTITAFGSIDATAERILRSIAQQEAFVMGFAGYSITVGRGNFFNQSFPFVVERVLKKPMKAVGVPNFFVRNSAIGRVRTVFLQSWYLILFVFRFNFSPDQALKYYIPEFLPFHMRIAWIILCHATRIFYHGTLV